jgi:micrococcal nuclease
MKHIFLLSAIMVLFASGASAQSMIPAKDAARHVGEKVTICDKVVSENLKAYAIALYIGGDHPNQLLTVICRAAAKNKSKTHFDTPYQGKEICVTGVIMKDHDGTLVIRVTDPSQIKPFMVDNPVKQKSSLN